MAVPAMLTSNFNLKNQLVKFNAATPLMQKDALANSMEKSPSKSLSLVPILSQINPAYTLLNYLLKNHFNTIVPLIPWSYEWSLPGFPIKTQ
jgi:hypothetical protein